MASRRPSPFTETGELTSVGKMLAVRSIVLAVFLSILGFSVGNVFLGVVLPVLALSIPFGFMLFLRRQAKHS